MSDGDGDSSGELGFMREVIHQAAFVFAKAVIDKPSRKSYRVSGELAIELHVMRQRIDQGDKGLTLKQVLDLQASVENFAKMR